MLQQNFAYISTVHTSLCSYGIDKALNFVSPLPNSSHIQGSCCSAMVYSRYAQQVQEIAQNYSNTPFIFRDPYNVSVSLAKELLAYDQNTTLTPQQQAVYDQAVNMSKDHGPCCCQCWRWYALEGQAKYYIKNLNYNASTIAKLWGLEEGCGGL